MSVLGLLRSSVLYQEEGTLALPDMPQSHLEALPPASGTHETILLHCGEQVLIANLIERYVSFLLLHKTAYLRLTLWLLFL